MTYRWDVQDRLTKDYRCFVHFCTNSVILAQQDHVLAAPTSQWQVGQTVSDGPWNVALAGGVVDGDYDWFIGLYDLSDGSRVPLQGVDDGTRRIRLRTLRLANAGLTLSFTPETNAPTFAPGAWYARHLNTSNNLVDFGDARTDGSAWLRREGNTWLLKTWPRERSFTLEFSRARFEQPAIVNCKGGSAKQIKPVDAGSRWRLPLNGAAEYRWTNSPPRLSIVRTNEALVVSWPADARSFALESAPEPTPTANWPAVTNPVLEADGRLSVTLPADAVGQFQRLRY